MHAHTHTHTINLCFPPHRRCAANWTSMPWTIRGKQRTRYCSSIGCRRLEVKHLWSYCDACRREINSILDAIPCSGSKWFVWIIANSMNWCVLSPNYQSRPSTSNTSATPTSQSNYYLHTLTTFFLSIVRRSRYKSFGGDERRKFACMAGTLFRPQKRFFNRSVGRCECVYLLRLFNYHLWVNVITF